MRRDFKIEFKKWQHDVPNINAFKQLINRFVAPKENVKPSVGQDCWFWSVTMAEIRRVQPSTIEELKSVVEAYAKSLTKAHFIKAVSKIYLFELDTL